MMQKNNTIALTALCLGFFMVIMDVTIVNVALPSIALNLHTTISGLQWVVAGYTLVFACFLLFAGHLADQIGARKNLIAGLVFFVITSLACGLAHTIQELILFRLLQGASAAALVPSSLTLIKTLYEDKKELAKAIGIWGGVGGIAAAAGPVLGAILTYWISWRAVFFVNIPIGLFAIILVIHSVGESKINPNVHFDLKGQIAAILMIASLAFVLIEGGDLGWSSIIVMIAGLVFVLSLITFILIEHHARQPMFPLSFFKSRPFTISMIIGIFLNAGLYGELFVLPLYFQGERGYSVMMTGFAILPLLILVALSSYSAGKLASHYGPKLPLSLGLIIGVLGFFSLLIVGQHTPNYAWLIAPLAAVGFGTALTMPAATMIAMHALPPDRAGIASGAFNTSRQLGSLIGVAVFGTVIAASQSFMHGMHVTLIIAGVLFFIGFLLSSWLK